MRGQLFAQDILLRGVQSTEPWQNLDEVPLNAFEAALRGVYGSLGADSTLHEALTEQELIHPVLAQLGWGGDRLPQVNLLGKGREDVPDIQFFHDPATKARALAETRDSRRWRPSAGWASWTGAMPNWCKTRNLTMQ